MPTSTTINQHFLFIINYLLCILLKKHNMNRKLVLRNVVAVLKYRKMWTYSENSIRKIIHCHESIIKYDCNESSEEHSVYPCLPKIYLFCQLIASVLIARTLMSFDFDYVVISKDLNSTLCKHVTNFPCTIGKQAIYQITIFLLSKIR